MRILTDEDQAMEQLISMVQGNTSPVLEVDELQRCLDDARLAYIWTASTDYSTGGYGLGAVVIPSAAKRNGYRYRLTAFDGTGSTSAATEPSWPTGYKRIVTDGNVTWKEDGPDYAQLWDMNDAAMRAWLLKASKVAQCTDFRQDGVGFTSSQLYDHCISQAMVYQGVQIA